MKSAHVMQSGLSREPESNVDSILIVTDLAEPECAFHMERVNPYPQDGDDISAGTRHVWWKGERYKKLGYWFDPSTQNKVV